MKEELLQVAEKVMNAARAAGVECEALVQKKRFTSVAVEAGKVTFGSQDGDYGIGLRIIRDRRTGYAYCDEASIDYGLKQAIQAARFGKPGNYEFHANARYDGTRSIYDNKLATLVVEDGIEMARDMIEAGSFDSRATPSRGGLSFGTASFAVANTNGIMVYDEGTFIGGHVMSVLKDGGIVVNGDEGESSRRLSFSVEEVGRKATEKAIAQLGQKGLETGTMDVILRPDAAFDLFSSTVLPALYGDNVRKGESVYSGRLGEKVASDTFSIVDDGTHHKGLNTFIMDEEGYPSQRTVIMDKGVLSNLLYDQFSAAEAGAKPTGSAMHTERNESGTTYKVPPTTCARNIVFEGDTMTEEEMIRGVRDGIIIEHVLGAHTANRVSGDFSVAIYAGYRIKDGQIAHPLKGGMIGGNLPALLQHATIADNYKLVEAGMSAAAGYIPSVKLEKVRVSG
ncbi:TldD/PmbA family protein [Methanocella arvoryzae]|uniref:Predicted peptidase (U62 family) n=1 Tax=Methanocella arvoryzae (strain DSM 22066 / NBRC 105507 / MRE50) TaxID=351160 RepID=Q0W1K0_METAR|nr:TldD/PmbA family protein [Methanocella arvoryzae]CAJ37743.1 predicted peptidase (U62 family) [Methanocella arvoryzae MRE50]